MTDRNLTTTRQQVFGDVPKGTRCRICGRDVEDGRAKFCSEYCRDICQSVMGLLNWPAVRGRVIERDDATCQACGFKRAWIRRGNDHIRALIEERLPERPENPGVLEIADGVDYDWDAHRRRMNARRDYKAALQDRYGDPYGEDPRLEVDHITPISEGGHPFDPANLRTLCEDCHEDKTARENSAGPTQEPERPEIELVAFTDGGGA